MSNKSALILIAVGTVVVAGVVWAMYAAKTKGITIAVS